MLKRVYIDNYRTFQNFECELGREQLLLGANGSGKSNLWECLLSLRQFVVGKIPAEQTFPDRDRTSWDRANRVQTFVLDVELDSQIYRYSLKLHFDDFGKSFVALESLEKELRPLLSVRDGNVTLFSGNQEIPYRISKNISVFSSYSSLGVQDETDPFYIWFDRLFCLHIDPRQMSSLAGATPSLMPTAEDFVSWYAGVEKHVPEEQKRALHESLTMALPGFTGIELRQMQTESVFVVGFEEPGGPRYLAQLSDGQRCLIVLYTMVHFAIPRGATLLIDEPDNFLALREIQPWLFTLIDQANDGDGQAILLSHHPEILNQLAHNALYFHRDGTGPTQVKPFWEGLEYSLSPADIVARGWERD